MLTVNQATLIQCGFHEGECITISAFKRTKYQGTDRECGIPPILLFRGTTLFFGREKNIDDLSSSFVITHWSGETCLFL